MSETNNQKPGSKTIVKTNGKEFKSLIKECLKELINEGALDKHLLELANRNMGQQRQPIQVIDPQLQFAAQVGAAVGKGNPMYEGIFADTMANTVPVQTAADPQRFAQGYANQMAQMNPYVQPQQQYVQPNPYVQQPQQYLNSGNPYIQEGGMPQQAPQMQPQQQQNTGGYPTLWAKYAFSKPLSNRPSGNSVLSGLMGGMGG